MGDLVRAPMPIATALEQIRIVVRGESAERVVDAVRADLSGRFTT
jgi:hypothetical protein